MVQSSSLAVVCAGCPSAGRSLLGWRGEDRIHRVLRLMCVVRLSFAHLDSRGGCAGCAGVPVRGSRGWAGLPSVASWWLLGSCPAGGRRFSESRWRPLGVQSMSVSKLCGSLCSGAPRVRSGQRAGSLGDWLSARSRRISRQVLAGLRGHVCGGRAARAESFQRPRGALRGAARLGGEPSRR